MGKNYASEDVGYFRVQQGKSGGWAFVDPSGEPFVSLVSNHLDDSDLCYPHNVDVFDRRHGTHRNWVRGVVRDLEDPNSNTIGQTGQYASGDWGKALDWFGDPIDLGRSSSWPDELLLDAGMPYVVQVRVQEIGDWNDHPAFRDVCSEDFQKYVDWVVRRMTSDHKNSRNPIEYLLVDIPAWLPHVSGRSWPGFEGPSFEEYDAKLFEVATQYYKTVTEAIRRYDPNHLILGDRYNGNKGTSETVLRVMAPFADVLSVQCSIGKTEAEYTKMISDLRQWYDITDKSVVIADIGNRVPTETNPHRASNINTYAECGEDYAQGLARVMAEPWIIGWHWCGYIENLGRGRGVKDPYGELYSDLIDRIREANAAVQTAVSV